ncbi:hypothetical protein COLU111180_19580 [Cohnella lubricantis]|uniref:Uncharacterized protein n=1 Tax=Cohnella lubricantis TaxID=2163172 RepID=A0A841TBR4_9BACL|nr:hypothetical protein [Cohnella lubricantis]MBB6678913.1 hypothetical protein [Cohnella lubricantis]MBP2120353.1 hypothetical protein [Cohnella lubricantis]
MSLLGKEWEIKLEMLRAIARSQDALARMLDSAADVTGASGLSATLLKEHVHVLTHMQRALLDSVAGTSWRSPVLGQPAPPWLSQQVYDGSIISQRHAEVIRLDAETGAIG